MSDRTSAWPTNRRVTVRDLRAAKERGERWAMLTAYDALIASALESAGVQALLVGDSASMVVFGNDTTLPVTIDELVPLVRAVARATHRVLIIADLPFGSYEASPDQALRSAVRFMKETGAHAVKLEGGARVVAQVRAIVDAGIPVMSHIGLTPQSVHASGGHRVQGRGEAGERLINDAKALEEAGSFAIVLEAVPADLGARITSSIDIPSVGIGAGPGCDAQVMVWQDLVGLTNGHTPKFVKRYADIRKVVTEAVESYVSEVVDGTYPGPEHTYQ